MSLRPNTRRLAEHQLAVSKQRLSSATQTRERLTEELAAFDKEIEGASRDDRRLHDRSGGGMNWFHRPPLHPRWLLLPLSAYLACSALGWI